MWNIVKAFLLVALICSLFVAVPIAGMIIGIALAIIVLAAILFSKSDDKSEGE